MENFGLKLNGKFNPRLDSFKDLKLKPAVRVSSIQSSSVQSSLVHFSTVKSHSVQSTNSTQNTELQNPQQELPSFPSWRNIKNESMEGGWDRKREVGWGKGRENSTARVCNEEWVNTREEEGGKKWKDGWGNYEEEGCGNVSKEGWENIVDEGRCEAWGELVSPLEAQSGVRRYTCNQCPGAIFNLLDGPSSVREHVQLRHQDIQ